MIAVIMDSCYFPMRKISGIEIIETKGSIFKLLIEKPKFSNEEVVLDSFFAMRPWANYLNFLCLNFLISKWDKTIFITLNYGGVK